jgi:hypothetical protein
MARTCRHCGGEVPEVGVLFCPFCNKVLIESIPAPPPPPPEENRPARVNEKQFELDRLHAGLLAIGLSVAVFAVLIGTSLERGFQSTVVRAFGGEPLGMSPGMFGLILLTTVLSPLPWIFHHLFLIEKQARRDGQWTRGLLFALLVVFMVDRRHPHLRWSKWIVLAGFLYFLLLAVAWGTYERHLGI